MEESFVFYGSFYEALTEQPESVRVKVYDAICLYALTGMEPQLSGAAKSIFVMARPQLDANKKRRKNGERGGRPQKATDADTNGSGREKPMVSETSKTEKPMVSEKEQNKKPMVLQKEQTEKPNVNVNVNANANVNVNANANVCVPRAREGEPAVGKAAFAPPTHTQITKYAAEIGKTMDVQRFADYYASKGWMVGNTPMRDWRAAVRGWDADKYAPLPTGGKTAKMSKPVSAQNYNQRQYREEDFDRLFADPFKDGGGA